MHLTDHRTVHETVVPVTVCLVMHSTMATIGREGQPPKDMVEYNLSRTALSIIRHPRKDPSHLLRMSYLRSLASFTIRPISNICQLRIGIDSKEVT